MPWARSTDLLPSMPPKQQIWTMTPGFTKPGPLLFSAFWLPISHGLNLGAAGTSPTWALCWGRRGTAETVESRGCGWKG